MMAKDDLTTLSSDDDYVNNMKYAVDLYAEIWKKTFEALDDQGYNPTSQAFPQVMQDMMQKVMQDPDAFYQKQLELVEDYTKVWANIWARGMGEDVAPVYESNPKDRRFRDEAWQNNLLFDFIRQCYTVTSHWSEDVVKDLAGGDVPLEKKFEFYTRQYLDAMSPSNFAMTNPQVLKEMIDTKGQNLVKGMQNLLEDIEKSNGMFSISVTDKDAFVLGENIACTPGKVVFRNRMMELIQYTPTCKKTFETPLLLIPAWINKYYILDLSPENSMVKWLVDQGHTVFVISWVNPDASYKDITFDDYLQEGALAALDAIEQATGQTEVNISGYCLGGTLVTCLLAYLEEKGQADRVRSATFLTTLVDFSDSGDLKLLVDEDQMVRIEKHMEKNGYLDGREMSAIFSAIRANDLIWSFVVNHYLMGKEPFPFDILYWNSDPTSLPAATHSFYLRQMYLYNNLAKNKLTLLDTPIKVNTVKTPSFFLATRDDHIAPWQSTYLATQLFKGPKEFILAGSGHVAGVINSPSRNKYGFVTNQELVEKADEWLQHTTQHQGSWWEHWQAWLAQYSGKKIPAPQPGDGKLMVMENAPGSYVKVSTS